MRGDLETPIVHADLLKVIIGSPDPKTRTRESKRRSPLAFANIWESKVPRALRTPRSTKERHERGVLNSVEFLKQLLELARDLVATEKKTPRVEDEDRGNAALTKLFEQVKNEKTPVVLSRVVADIDAIIRLVRLLGWQQTAAGEREVKKACERASSSMNFTKTQTCSRERMGASASSPERVYPPSWRGQPVENSLENTNVNMERGKDSMDLLQDRIRS